MQLGRRAGACMAESESLSREGEEQPEDLSDPQTTEGVNRSMCRRVSRGECRAGIELEDPLS